MLKQPDPSDDDRLWWYCPCSARIARLPNELACARDAPAEEWLSEGEMRAIAGKLVKKVENVVAHHERGLDKKPMSEHLKLRLDGSDALFAAFEFVPDQEGRGILVSWLAYPTSWPSPGLRDECNEIRWKEKVDRHRVVGVNLLPIPSWDLEYAHHDYANRLAKSITKEKPHCAISERWVDVPRARVFGHALQPLYKMWRTQALGFASDNQICIDPRFATPGPFLGPSPTASDDRWALGCVISWIEADRRGRASRTPATENIGLDGAASRWRAATRSRDWWKHIRRIDIKRDVRRLFWDTSLLRRAGESLLYLEGLVLLIVVGIVAMTHGPLVWGAFQATCVGISSPKDVGPGDESASPPDRGRQVSSIGDACNNDTDCSSYKYPYNEASKSEKSFCHPAKFCSLRCYDRGCPDENGKLTTLCIEDPVVEDRPTGICVLVADDCAHLPGTQLESVNKWTGNTKATPIKACVPLVNQ